MPIADTHARSQVRSVYPNALVAAADLHQQHRLDRRVVFVVAEFVYDLQPVFTVLLRPVAGFARLARGTQAAHGRGDGRLISVEHHREHLPDSRELAAHKPRFPRPDMALHALDRKSTRLNSSHLV